MNSNSSRNELEINEMSMITTSNNQNQIHSISSSANTSSSSSSSHNNKNNTLNTSQLVFYLFFSVCGGAFGLEDILSSISGRVYFCFGSILFLMFFWSIPNSITVSEFATAFPRMGGRIVWVRQIFGNFWSLQTGLFQFVQLIFNSSLFPVLFVDYWNLTFKPLSSTQQAFVIIGVVFIFAAINLTHSIGIVSTWFGVIVLLPFVILVLLGLQFISFETLELANNSANQTIENENGEITDTGNSSHDFALFLSVLVWNWSGWENVGNIAHQANDPNSSYPRSLFLSNLLISACYILPLLVGICADVHVHNGKFDPSLWKAGYFVQIADYVGGNLLKRTMGLCALVSALGMGSVSLCSASKSLACLLVDWRWSIFRNSEDRLPSMISNTTHTTHHSHSMVESIVENCVFVCSFVVVMISLFLPFQILVQISVSLKNEKKKKIENEESEEKQKERNKD